LKVKLTENARRFAFGFVHGVWFFSR